MEPGEALGLGLALSGISVVMLALAANWFAAAFLAFTIFFYAVVYTMWLKRSTPQNIVIGGAAGAFPPMIGWAVATGGISIESLLMFALIFMWTPPHFWALALFMKDDYTTARVPMLTVTHGRRVTRTHILVYTRAIGAGGAGPCRDLDRRAGLSGCKPGAERDVLLGAWRIWQRDEAQAEADNYRVEKAFFRFSLFYLFLHFVGFAGRAALRRFGWGGW